MYLENYRSECVDEKLKKLNIDVIFVVADVIKSFSKLEFGSGKIRRIDQINFLIVIFVLELF